MSPEVYEKRAYDVKCDIWALGCVLYEMCTNKIAFESETEENLKKAICGNKMPSLPSNYPNGLRNTFER